MSFSQVGLLLVLLVMFFLINQANHVHSDVLVQCVYKIIKLIFNYIHKVLLPV